MNILLSIVANAVALVATAYVVPGITFGGSWVQLLVAGAIFGVLNLIVRPIALLLSLPLLVLTPRALLLRPERAAALGLLALHARLPRERPVGGDPRQPRDHGRSTG